MILQFKHYNKHKKNITSVIERHLNDFKLKLYNNKQKNIFSNAKRTSMTSKLKHYNKNQKNIISRVKVPNPHQIIEFLESNYIYE